MTSRDFCFWLQGYLEIASVEDVMRKPGTYPILTIPQVECIRKHLALVFKHEIDPSMGGQAHQDELNQIHGTGPTPPQNHLLRC